MQKSICELGPFPSAMRDELVSVQGIVDCMFGDGKSWTIVDYKTDRITDETTFVSGYQAQLSLYREAVEKTFGNPVRGAHYIPFILTKLYGCSLLKENFRKTGPEPLVLQSKEDFHNAHCVR